MVLSHVSIFQGLVSFSVACPYKFIQWGTSVFKNMKRCMRLVKVLIKLNKTFNAALRWKIINFPLQLTRVFRWERHCCDLGLHITFQRGCVLPNTRHQTRWHLKGQKRDLISESSPGPSWKYNSNRGSLCKVDGATLLWSLLARSSWNYSTCKVHRIGFEITSVNMIII